jgi:uncharacterized protein
MENLIDKPFKDYDYYKAYSEYELFPFHFHKFDNQYLTTTETGEYIFLDREQLSLLIHKQLNHSTNEKLFNELVDKQFIYLKRNTFSIQQKAIKYRTKKQFITTGAVLHVFVVTTRCEHKCQYCQITPQDKNATQYDMSIETARKSVELMMQFPSKSITVEFQGGETLLAFDVVKEIVNYTNELNQIKNKNITFVLATSLVNITDNQLYFIKEKNIHLSTSLDGPEDLHNQNRPIKSQNTYQKFKEGFIKSQEITGKSPSPLLTISRSSLDEMKNIINEYLLFECHSISLRALSPYGFAVKTKSKIGYSVDDYIKFYENALSYIIELNKLGTYFREDYTTLLLRRILTPYSTGYVDLQSPSGAGISAMVYYYNGEIYPADEARMLSEMGDKSFLLGNVYETTFKELTSHKKLQTLINDSCAESLNECSECTYLQYCGCDPLFNYVTQKDHIGHRPTSDFCKKQKAIYKIIFTYLKENDRETINIFWSWINNTPHKEILE